MYREYKVYIFRRQDATNVIQHIQSGTHRNTPFISDRKTDWSDWPCLLPPSVYYLALSLGDRRHSDVKSGASAHSQSLGTLNIYTKHIATK